MRLCPVVGRIHTEEVHAMRKPFVYSLIVLSALVFGTSRFGFSQQPATTNIAGGQGGFLFADTEIPSGSRVIEVHVFSGKFVDAVQMAYRLPDGRILMGPKHGGPGGQQNIFRIDSDEYITGISGLYGKYIDSLQIHTNKRTSPVFGGSGGDRQYRINVPDRNHAVGFTGRSAEYLDAVGLTYLPIRIQQISQTNISGGNGGSEFSDTDIPVGARISEIRIRSSQFVDSIQAVYVLREGSIFEGPVHGGGGGNFRVFRLDSDEYITGVSGRYGSFIDSIVIQTNKRTSPVFGGRGGNRSYRISVPPGNQAIGFVGRAGKYLDAIGLNYASTSRLPQQQRRDRFRVPR